MHVWTITLTKNTAEDVESEGYTVGDPFTSFYRREGNGTVIVKALRTDDIKRIELKG